MSTVYKKFKIKNVAGAILACGLLNSCVNRVCSQVMSQGECLAHLTSSLCLLASNGLAKRTIQILKQCMRNCRQNCQMFCLIRFKTLFTTFQSPKCHS